MGALVASDRPIEPKSLIVTERGREVARIAWQSRRTLVGRGRQADVRCDEATMSCLHVELVPGPAGVILRDLSSRNGTYVNGVRVEQATLFPGDEIEIGEATIALSLAPPYEVFNAEVPLESRMAERLQ
jgi:pSer/pThr/pTyr-binding forkhead associated (FHA) protein